MTNKTSESKYIMTAEVYEQIRSTIGVRRPENGGILGSSDGVHIDHYYFDSTSDRSAVTYTMDHKALNEVIHSWNDNGVDLIGIIHSHPAGCTQPSYGDMLMAKRIIETMDVKGRFFTPIVQVSSKLNGDIKIYPYTFEQVVHMHEQAFEIDRPKKAQATMQQRALDAKAPNRHKRIEGILPQSVVSKKKIICVGCGGSRSFLEALARCGIRSFVLIDGDTVEDTNIATQGAYISELGKPKTEVIKSRILDIEPLADVVCIQRFLDDSITDEEFFRLAGLDGFDCKDVLMCGCTDNFFAQDRCAQLSLKYGLPYLAAQIFAGGTGHEVIFSYPQVTASCPRCMLSSRYEKELSKHSSGTGSSAGAAIAITEHLNAVKLYTALELLCYDDKQSAYYHKLDRHADRNYLMTRCTADLKAPAFEPLDKLAETESDLSFAYTTVAIGQTPEENCPLCGGKGDLKKLKGNIADTRIIWK